ncbi:Component of a membrane-bound complex containing the Tor2p kinase, partial [Coemansia sp. RSA 2618]
TSFKIPLASLRDDRTAGSTLLKRSATLPTKRAGASNYSANSNSAAAAAASQKSRWVGGYTDGAKPGWVAGARDTGWDNSSDEDDVTPLSRRNAGTKTWYGPRAGIRPISMFPQARANAQYPVPPVPLMFGADDSDDDIDLEGDEGSSRTPAALGLGRGLRLYAASPGSSARSIRDLARPSHKDLTSIFPERSHKGLRFVATPSALATSVPVLSPLSLAPTPLAVSGVKYEHLTQDASASRPRGISDPEGRQSSRSSHVQSSAHSSWRPADADSSRPGSKDGAKPQQLAADGPKRPASGSEPLTVRELSATAGGAFRMEKDKDPAAYVPPPAPKTSGLAALLATKLVVRHNPFSGEFGAVGGAAGDSNLVELNIFVQLGGEKSAPQTVRVRRTATVEQAIGYALFRHIEDECTPVLAGDVQDVVMWALRIAMDGEVDDDFPAFDRTRPVANFAFDEFAL